MKKIVVGVDQAASLHPDNVMVTALCGVLRGAGTSIIKPLVSPMSKYSYVRYHVSYKLYLTQPVSLGDLAGRPLLRGDDLLQ